MEAELSTITDDDDPADSDGTADAASVDDAQEWFGSGWTTWKVAGLAIAVAFVAAVGALLISDMVSSPSEDSVDVGFLRDMIDHHGQAIQLGVVAADNATDDSVRHFGQEALIAQQYEVGYMTALLEDWGVGNGATDRDAMAWMDMPTSVENMPGMASAEELDAFRQMEGTDVDREFFRLMTDHHRGGLHMAEEAMQTASDPRASAGRAHGPQPARRDRRVQGPGRQARHRLLSPPLPRSTGPLRHPLSMTTPISRSQLHHG